MSIVDLSGVAGRTCPRAQEWNPPSGTRVSGLWTGLHRRWLGGADGAANDAGPVAVDLDAALIRPAEAFGNPRQVILHPLLTPAQKREILRRWEWDARLIETAAAEGAPDGPPSRLEEVLDALRLLDRPDLGPKTPRPGPFLPDMGARPAVPADVEAVGLAAALMEARHGATPAPQRSLDIGSGRRMRRPPLLLRQHVRPGLGDDAVLG